MEFRNSRAIPRHGGPPIWIGADRSSSRAIPRSGPYDTFSRVTRSTVLALTFVLACTYSKKEHVAASIDGRVEAKVVSVDRKQLTVDAIGGGHVGILVPAKDEKQWCELRIVKPKRVVLNAPGPCDDDSRPYQLAADPEGTRLAYTIGNSTWDIIYFGNGDRSFEGVKQAPKGPIDWSTVPTLEQTLPDIFREHMEDHAKDPSFPTLIIDEAVSRGQAMLARVLEATMDDPVDGEKRAIEDGKEAFWTKAYRRLEGDALARVNAALERRLENVAHSPGAARAVLHVDVDRSLPTWSPKLAAGIAARPERDHDWAADWSTAILLARWAKADARAAAPVGCSLLGRARPPDDSASAIANRRDLTSALAAAAVGGLDCAAARDLDREYEQKYTTKSPDGFDRGYCKLSGWFCPSSDDWRKPTPRCTKESARERVARRLARSLDEERKPEGKAMEFHEALAAAVLVHGIDPKRTRAIERQTYTPVVPDGARPCEEIEWDGGGTLALHCDPSVPILDDPKMCDPGPIADTYHDIRVHWVDAKREVFFTPMPEKFDAGHD